MMTGISVVVYFEHCFYGIDNFVCVVSVEDTSDDGSFLVVH